MTTAIKYLILLKLKRNTCALTNSNFSTAYRSPLPNSFYNDEQKAIQKKVSKILATEILPNFAEWEKIEQTPTHHLIKILGKEGLLGIRFPKEYGGSGLSYKYKAAYLEEMGTAPAAGTISGIIGHMVMTLPALSRFGSDKLKKEFLVPSLAGDILGCLGVSEPHAGSDVSQIKTTATRKEDDLIINGQKMWVTNGMQADWICLLANTTSGAKHSNKSLICVPMNSEGIQRRKIKKIGWHSSDTAQLFFDQVRVPAANIIGDEGSGFFYQMLQFEEERLSLALVSLRAFDNCIGQTIDYTRERTIKDKPILDHQAVYFCLSELATEVEALRAITYQAVDMMVAGEDVTRLATMAKLKLGKLSRIVPTTCMQFWGGRGYLIDNPVSRLYLDYRMNAIGGGADEVMLEILGKLMNIAPSRDRSRDTSQ